MHIDALPFLLLAPPPYIQPIHLLLPTPSDQSSPAARGYQSPSCVGPVKWKMAATERAHFREPSSFEGAWWPLTATVLTRSPHQHSTAIIVFTKVRGDQGETLLVDVWNQGRRAACLSHATVVLWGNMTWDHSQSGGDCVSTCQSRFQWKCHWVCVLWWFFFFCWSHSFWQRDGCNPPKSES